MRESELVRAWKEKCFHLSEIQGEQGARGIIKRKGVGLDEQRGVRLKQVHQFPDQTSES